MVQLGRHKVAGICETLARVVTTASSLRVQAFAAQAAARCLLAAAPSSPGTSLVRIAVLYGRDVRRHLRYSLHYSGWEDMLPCSFIHRLYRSGISHQSCQSGLSKQPACPSASFVIWPDQLSLHSLRHQH